MEVPENILKWKTPIWFTKRAQCTRILRYSEAKAIISAIRNERNTDNPWEDTLDVPRSVIQIWLQALLVTGMRMSELWILHEHPELWQDNGAILLERDKFYDVGKKKQRTMERTVYLSDMGIPIMERFYKVPMLADDFKTANRALGSMLHNAGKAIKLPERTFIRRINSREAVQIDGKTEWKITGNKDSQQITNGVMVRSFRKTWDSWLVNAYHQSSPTFLMLIERSIGHSIQTAMKDYLTFNFDQEDLGDIKKAVKGFGELRNRDH